MSFRIALVPLDDRPCNYQYLQDLVAIAGLKLSSLAPTDSFEKRAKWLENTLSNKDALIVNLEGWLYGSLIHSRKMEISESETEARLLKLSELLNQHPQVQIYLSSVLLRLSITLNAEQSERNWRDVFRFSTLKGKENLTSSEVNELHETEARIPPSILHEYLSVRERNHRIQLKAVQLFSKRARFFVFGQEDCAPHGLHVKEKEAIRDAVIESKEAPRFQILTGADELGAALLARAYSDHLGVSKLQLGVWTSDPSTLKMISKYEDIPVYENLRLHAELCYFQLLGLDDRKLKESDPRLLIQCFSPQGQSDLCFKPSPISENVEFPLVSLLKPNDAVLDLSHANGADPGFMKAVIKKNLPSAFSAWNTTGNRMGTLFAHLSFQILSKKSNAYCESADRSVRNRSLLDDFLYQSIVRQKLQDQAERESCNPWALGPRHAEYSAACQEEMLSAIREFGFSTEFLDFRATLPWPRLFEVLLRDAYLLE